MKVSRIIAFCLLVPLGGFVVVAVYLHAQDPDGPRVVPVRPGFPQRGPNTAVLGNSLQGAVQVPMYRSPYDPKTAQLFSDEQVADQEARSLAASYAAADNDELRANIKKKLREKLVAIFETQQKRRTAEIASIEERLAKLKDVSKKREANKDPIVNRRLDQLTGGTDELGWEESGGATVRYSAGPGGFVVEAVPGAGNYPSAPRFDLPALPPPETVPVPSK